MGHELESLAKNNKYESYFKTDLMSCVLLMLSQEYKILTWLL